MDGSGNHRIHRRRALFLGNLGARKVAQQLDEAFERLREAGFQVLPKRAKKPGDLSRLILEHHKSVDFVVVGGGDGTLNAAAEGLVKTRLPLGILPLGTANDLAHTLGISADLDDACQVIAEGHSREIDVGSVNGKYYFNAAGMGMSVDITSELTRDVKKRWGVMAYLISAGRVLRHLRPFRAQIRIGDEVHRTRTVQITVGNGRFYGGFLSVADDATIDDQWLDLFTLEIERWWQLAPLLWALKSGRLKNHAYVRTFRATEFEVRTKKKRAINADGEIIAYTPATFRIHPRAVTVFAPPVPDAGLSEEPAQDAEQLDVTR
ncbi:MAG: lipid kinase [Planctomycetes bacterium]|nr:lipid kinase [Planctomycetota bacterium]